MNISSSRAITPRNRFVRQQTNAQHTDTSRTEPQDQVTFSDRPKKSGWLDKLIPGLVGAGAMAGHIASIGALGAVGAFVVPGLALVGATTMALCDKEVRGKFMKMSTKDKLLTAGTAAVCGASYMVAAFMSSAVVGGLAGYAIGAGASKGALTAVAVGVTGVGNAFLSDLGPRPEGAKPEAK